MTSTMTQADLLDCPFCGGPAKEIMGLFGCEPCALVRRDAASWNTRALRTATPEPVAWQWSDFSGKWYTPDTSRLTLDEQEAVARAAAAEHEGRLRAVFASPSIPQTVTEAGREISEAQVQAAAIAIDAHWSDGQDRGPAFEETEREYQDHCRTTARAALTAALSPGAQGHE
jgi:hypothetical protein